MDSNGGIFRKIHGEKVGTAIECIVADRSRVFGNSDGEDTAMIERIIADGLHAVGDIETL